MLWFGASELQCCMVPCLLCSMQMMAGLVRTKGAQNTTINHNVNTRRERAIEQDPSGGAP
jgi:hypothetical protein